MQGDEVLLTRSVDEPIRENLSWAETWQSEDRGLIKCWENGLAIRQSNIPEQVRLTESVNAGELPVLDWVGGLSKALKGKKAGCLQYLATLQGIQGKPLCIDTEKEVSITCTKTGTTVVYTNKQAKIEAGRADN